MTVAFNGRDARRIDGPLRLPQAVEVPPQPAQATPLHDARRLTGPGGTAQIILDGQLYVLRITRAGKLILTK
ncbi:MAG: hemin uptake protein HemP [Paracoccaceae bacterium]|nr:MAG: hemin uptake protein HemP [Paracoccaceae bacterium]